MKNKLEKKRLSDGGYSYFLNGRKYGLGLFFSFFDYNICYEGQYYNSLWNGIWNGIWKSYYFRNRKIGVIYQHKNNESHGAQIAFTYEK